MLTIHLLGHAHVTQHNRPVPISAKAVALVTYLSIEKLPQHRERLADLLWTTAEARKNLRVELARIRTAGLNLFPASQQLLYLENVTTDFDVWQNRMEQDLNQAQLAEWLAMLRGFPLSGMEDLGSSSFQEWVDQQRWMLSQQIEDGLSRMYWRYAREQHTWATRLIAARADTLGLELSSEPVLEPPREKAAPSRSSVPVQPRQPAPLPSFSDLHFERTHEEQELQQLQAAAAAGKPQLLMLHGPPGAGKSYLAERLATQAQARTIRVTNTRSSRLVLASLAQAALADSDPECAEALRRVLLTPVSLEEDTVKVAVALARLQCPVMLIFDHVHDAPAELAPLLTFLMDMPSAAPRFYLLLSRKPPVQAPLTRALRTQKGGAQSSGTSEMEVFPLTQTSVHHALAACFPMESALQLDSWAARLVQRSEGNPLHLLSLLEQAGGLERLQGSDPGYCPQVVRDTHSADIDQWPVSLVEAMSRLSAIYGPFDRQVARAALGDPLAGSADSLLYSALERHILRELEPEGVLQLPGFNFVPAPHGGETQYLFASEGLRIALASRSPQLVREDVRRRLVPVLAADAPGLAAYYAQRAGLAEDAGVLQQIYRAQLHARQIPAGNGAWARPVLSPPTAVPEPRRAQVTEQAPVARQGYLVATDDNGWLNVCSVGRYGHPQTLKLALNLPESLAQGELRVVWRLDVFQGSEELGPSRAPFALRLGRQGSSVAHVLTPGSAYDYLEEGVHHLVHPEVRLGHWMEHRLAIPVDGSAGRSLELSVRAPDVALTIGELSWQGQTLLPHSSDAGNVRAGYTHDQPVLEISRRAVHP